MGTVRVSNGPCLSVFVRVERQAERDLLSSSEFRVLGGRRRREAEGPLATSLLSTYRVIFSNGASPGSRAISTEAVTRPEYVASSSVASRDVCDEEERAAAAGRVLAGGTGS